MKSKRRTYFIPKIIFWTSFFVITFTGMSITADSLGFKIPGISFPSTGKPQRDLFGFTIFTEAGTRKMGEDLSKTTTQMTSSNQKRFKSRNIAKAAVRRSGDNFSKTTAQITHLNQKRFHSRNLTTHIAFLKVHKAGSTTMQNLFFRFGQRHKLNILLPKYGNYLLQKQQQVPIKPTNHYDIFACHTVYSKTLFDSLLPVDAVKIGIIREPLDRMISAAYYYRDVWSEGYLKKVPRGNFIHNLVQYPEKYERSFFSRTRNSMGKDFGFPLGIKSSDKAKINKLLEKLNSEFLLVMSTERFDESLALLRRLLGWSFVDILYYQTNSHKHSPVILNETEQAKFKETSFLDFHIYDYFTEELDSKIKKQDSDFPKEVEFFKSTLEKVSLFCDTNSKFTKTKLFIGKTKWDNAFSVSKEDCMLMKTQELSFVKMLRQTQVLSK